MSYPDVFKNKVNESITLFGSTDVNLTASISIAYFPMHGETSKALINLIETC